MNEKRFFQDRPSINASGSYTYLSGNNSSDYQQSDSVPTRYDKFRKNDLYTTAVGDTLNEKIIQSYFDEPNYDRLKYNSPSFITVDDLFIDFNERNVGKVDDTKFHGFIVSQRALELNNEEEPGAYANFGNVLKPIKNEDGSFKNFETLRQQFFYMNDHNGPGMDGDNRSLDEVGEWFQENPPVLDTREPPPGYVVQGATILKNLNEGVNRTTGDAPDGGYETGPTPDTAVFGNEADPDEFRPSQVFWVSNTDTDNTMTKIFDEGMDASLNPIYFIFYLRGNKKGGSNRKKRIQIYEINPLELFNRNDDGNIVSGKITKFQLGEGIIIDQDENSLAPAFKITEFNVTINTMKSEVADYNPNPVYNTVLESILAPQSNDPININNIEENILTINPYRELTYAPTSTESDDIPNEYFDFIPTPHITIKNTNLDLQAYYISEIQRQVVSAPTTVEMSFTISNPTTNGSVLQNRRTDIVGNADNSNYFYCVLSWNDIDDKFKSIEDILDDLPTTNIELADKKNQNLYSFNDISKPIFNDYVNPGIKNIKILVFNYMTDTNNLIEPVRWKLVTARIFLDIPVSQFPDFGEVGGADYTTIPWPYTTPIIGGISKNSKYLKSIDDTLGGGKVGPLDIIDETFLVDAQENNELGANIESMDLEQVRFFNKSYDLGSLLNIGTSNLGQSDIGIFRYDPDMNTSDTTTDLRFNTLITSNEDNQNTDVFNQAIGGDSLITFYEMDAIESTFNGFGIQVGDGSVYRIKLQVSQEAYEFENANPNIWPITQLLSPMENSYMDFTIDSVADTIIIGDDFTTIVYYNITVINTYYASDFSTIVNQYVGWRDNLPDGISYTANWYDVQLINYKFADVEFFHRPWTSTLWTGANNGQKFPMESSVGQIFINENQDIDLKESCTLELNTGNLTGKSILDSSGHLNKGLLIGDYKIKKTQKNQPMRRDSFIKVPKKASNSKGAL